MTCWLPGIISTRCRLDFRNTSSAVWSTSWRRSRRNTRSKGWSARVRITERSIAARFANHRGQQRTTHQRRGDHCTGVPLELAAPVRDGFHARLELLEIRHQVVTRASDVGCYLVSCLAHSTFSLTVAVVFGA